jgi:exodeoxyribonuclease V beta subunit
VAGAWLNKSYSGIDRTIHGFHPDGGNGQNDFPPGKAAGTLLHALFEKTEDFSLPPSEEERIRNALEASRRVKLEASQVEWAIQKIKTVLNKKLPGIGISLSQVPPENHDAELGFVMDIAGEGKDKLASARKILGILPDDCKPASEDLYEQLDKEFFGFLNGTIDLLFEWEGAYYVLDWKSNNLPAYDQANLEESMRRHNYHLQYALYGIAVERFLKRLNAGRERPQKLGGVFYVFLRGVEDGDGNEGIFFRKREELAWMDTLAELLEAK